MRKNVRNSLYNRIKSNRIKENDSIMCGYFCTRFFSFVLKGKSLLDYIKLFHHTEY